MNSNAHITSKSRLCYRAIKYISLILSLSLVYLLSAITNAAQPKFDPPRAGGPLPGLSSSELAFFKEGLNRFNIEDGIPDLRRQHKGKDVGGGLGPRFNLNSCAGCHSQPAIGGSSPAINPQIAVATLNGAKNTIPPFISINSPIREARFKFNPDGTRDGSVQGLFVITGRSDANPQCQIVQPDFATAIANNNIIYRIPTPLFGSGLIEAIADATILANKAANQPTKKMLGISGHENRNSNTNTITKFGWKAQNTLQVFSGEAYNVEIGVTNELFENKRDETLACLTNGLPEDHTDFNNPSTLDGMSDVVGFTHYMRFLAPPASAPSTPASKAGASLFSTIGCAMCHTPSMITGGNSTAALNNVSAQIYSDLLVHHMGPGLADNIIQGSAGPDEFRTAPLWGVSQRLFYLHDGRTSDLTQAILAHASTNPNCAPGQRTTPDGIACNSEANKVVDNFKALSAGDQANVIAFLQTL